MLISLPELNRAIADDELVPHFQPIVQLRTGQLSGFEVLTRWEHPVHGAYLPTNLIELAESSGLIGELTHQVFTKAFSLVAAVAEPLKLSVNLSPLQLAYPDLARQIEGMASAAGFRLDRLTIEITESALLSDLARSQGLARELKELGCRLSLDDFGTGYSSLAHLHALPFDELKIDRFFVSQMTKKRESRKIVAAIIGLGHSLSLSTVAEGIETQEQADMLLWLGSELGQGWHYGRASSFDSIRAMVAEPFRPAAAGLPCPGEDWAASSLEALPTQRLAQLQAIYDGAPVGLCFLDCSLRYVSMNQRLAEMNGASVAAHLGRTIQEMIPELYPNVEQYLLRSLEGEAISGVEIPRPKKGSEEMGWIMVSYQPAFDEADEVIGVSVSVMDISEQKRAKDELQESEFVQRHLIELNRQVPWVMDPEGNNLQMSSKWVRTDSAIKEQTRNLGWLEALHIDDLKPTIRKMKKALRTGERIDMEYRIQDTEGEWRWMRSRGLPRLGPNGEIKRWYGSVEDIHEKKCADAAARNTELKMRALLNAVPVAIIIDEGKERAIRIHESRPEEAAERFADTRPLREGRPTEIYPIAAKIQDHIFQDFAPSDEIRSRSEAPGKKKKTKVSVGLQIVDDVDRARKERKRLVTMLEEFAGQRAQG
jgi:PAS domain S-box-containing protein